MSDQDKLLSTLDKIEAKLNDFEKSNAAQAKAAVDGVAKVEKEIAEVRKQNQELAQTIATVRNASPCEKEMFIEMGKAIKNAKLGITNKAASEGTNADGGYAVNDELATVIRSAQNQYGVVRQIFGNQIIPMQSDVMKMPVDTFEDTGTVPIPASTSENAEISESTVAQLDQVTLTTSKYATLSKISNELVNDTFINGGYLGGYLLPKIARQASKLEDQIVLTASSTGLINTSNVQVLTMEGSAFADLGSDDLLDMQDQVVDDALENGMYIMHRSILSLTRKLKGTDNHPIFTPMNSGEPATIHGYPFMKARVMPAASQSLASKGFIIFGDLTLGCVVGERLGRQIVTSSERYLEYDQTAVRMTFRWAFNTNANIGRAICVLKTGAA